jgi:lipoprotein-anchoring transpeptidase ErfK/SrfK
MFSIVVKISKQRLYLYKNRKLVKQYAVSTSRYGAGNKQGSNKTPLGRHRIASKIGRNARKCEVIRNRHRTGKLVNIRKRQKMHKDLITSRVLWLEGLESGKNRGQGIDSKKRCIYIHGTPEEHLIGRPVSHGCIRMSNKDIMELFRLIARGTIVKIER